MKNKINSILFTTRNLSYKGGTEYYLFDLIKYLLNKKIYKIYLFECDFHDTTRKDFYDLLVNKGLQIISKEECTNDFCDVRNVQIISEIIKKYKIDLVHSALFNADFTVLIVKYGSNFVLNKLKNIQNYNDLLRLQKNIKSIKKINTESLNFKWISTKFCEFSVALEENTREWIRKKKIIDEQIEPIISSHADAIVAVSRNVREKWKKWNQKNYLIPCTSIGKEEIVLIDKLKKCIKRNTNNQLCFLVVSRLVNGKGIDDLIKAFKLYAKLFPNNLLKIAGDGEEKRCYKAMARKCNNILFLGQINKEQVLKKIANSDFFCLFSHSEGLSLSIQEAMASGKPILTTNVGGIPNLVENNVNGLLCKHKDIQGILDVLITATEMSSSKREFMGKASREKFFKWFVKESSFEQYKLLYNRILNK